MEDRKKNSLDFGQLRLDSERPNWGGSKDGALVFDGEMPIKGSYVTDNLKLGEKIISKVESINKKPKNHTVSSKKTLSMAKTKSAKALIKAIGIMKKIIDSYFYILLMMLITIYVLFISDINTAFMSTDSDVPISYTQLACFILFLIEIVMNVFVEKDYFMSFFFWLDIISTISILLDIDFIMNPLFNSGGTDVVVSGSSKSNKSTRSVAKAASAGRVTRILRIVRIIRIIRIVKLYKATVNARQTIEKNKRDKQLKKDNLKAMQTKTTQYDNYETIKNMVSQPPETEAKGEPFTNQLDSNKYYINQSQQAVKPIDLDSPHLINQKEDSPFTIIPIIDNIKKDPPLAAGEEIIKESNISKLLSNSITKKLILLILGLILGLTVINEDMYLDDPLLYDDVLSRYMEILQIDQYPEYNNSIYNYTVNDNTYPFIDTFFITPFDPDSDNITYTLIPSNTTLYYLLENIDPNSDDNFYGIDINSTAVNDYSTLPYILFRAASFNIDTPFSIINITLNGSVIFENITAGLIDYRTEEVDTSVSINGNVQIYHSIKQEAQLSGLLNIFKTLYIMAIIVIGAVVFESDSKNLVLDPLEIMIEIVELVEQDPIMAKNVESLKSGIKNQMMNNNNDQDKKKKNGKDRMKENKDRYEIKMIENSIVKISSLLAICFGDAGGDIIKQNIEKGKDFNPMTEGKKKHAIFGFCDIRQFPYVNDALQERTMIFVNQISEIVHSSIDRFSGATNKNIGDAYLSAWRFKKITEVDGKKITKEIPNDVSNPEAQSIADQAVLGFLQIIIKINSDIDILNYKKDEAIMKHHHLKNYKVKMGFGLHLGWAIEGAIGSTYKMDASYLSPNVNISARLEAATKQYGVYILISGELYDLCSSRIKKICRLIDIVAVKGSIKPIRLYTIDVNISNLPLDVEKKSPSTKKRYEKLIKMKELIHANALKNGGITNYILTSRAFKSLLTIKRPDNFLLVFNEAISNYIKGDWAKSGTQLTECLKMDPEDGPSKTIYNYLQSYNFKAVTEGDNKWEGYRALSSK